MERYELINNWFGAYVDSYLVEAEDFNEKILLKKKHSYRVVSNIRKLAESLDLNELDIDIVSSIALLHDVGRFEQLKKYNTFSDEKSEDHALLGVQIIQDNDVLSSFTEKEQENMLLAITYHNKFTVPAMDDNTVDVYTKLLRDADKLDIFKLVTDYYTEFKFSKDRLIELELPDKPAISKKIYESLMKEKSAEYKHLQTLADFKLLQMAWVYDINYKQSYKIINENSYIKHIYDTMSKTDEVIDVYRKVKIFLENSI
jgi:HD superfamily phosphodiesterase